MSEQAKNYNFLVVEDLPSLREHLRNLLEKHFSGRAKVNEAATAKSGLEAYQAGKPDMVITDISMPESSGIKMASSIWNFDRTAKILFWSQYNREAYVREIAKAIPDEAIHGYVLKSEPDEKLVYAIDSILIEDNPYIDPQVRGVQTRLSSKDKSLSDVEFETLLDITVGLTDKAIAVRRHISVRGVQNRIAMLSMKLLSGEDAHLRETAGYEVHNPRSRLIFAAIVRGLVDPDQIAGLNDGLAKWLELEFGFSG
jgi:DNA-binding NarL/FixJ family response regulator